MQIGREGRTPAMSGLRRLEPFIGVTHAGDFRRHDHRIELTDLLCGVPRRVR